MDDFIDEDVIIIPNSEEESDEVDMHYEEYEAFLWESANEADFDITFVGAESEIKLQEPYNEEYALRKLHFQKRIHEVMESVRTKLREKDEKTGYYDNTQSVGRKVYIEIIKIPSDTSVPVSSSHCACNKNNKVSKRRKYILSSEDDCSDSD